MIYASIASYVQTEVALCDEARRPLASASGVAAYIAVFITGCAQRTHFPVAVVDAVAALFSFALLLCRLHEWFDMPRVVLQFFEIWASQESSRRVLVVTLPMY